MDRKKTFVKSDDVVCRNIAGETMLVPIRNNVGDLESIYVLNPVASRVWELVTPELTLEQICRTIEQEFDAPPQQIEEDLGKIINDFLSINLIREG